MDIRIPHHAGASVRPLAFDRSMASWATVTYSWTKPTAGRGVAVDSPRDLQQYTVRAAAAGTAPAVETRCEESPARSGWRIAGGSEWQSKLHKMGDLEARVLSDKTTYEPKV